MEWASLGFDCGGAVLAWVGVAGVTSLAPVTGGLAALPAARLCGGALATSGECSVSSYRVFNLERGRTDINDELSDDPVYTWTMNAGDVVGIVGGGGALLEIRRTNAVVAHTHVAWGTALRRLSRPTRRRLTTALELQGGKRAPGATINRLLRQRILDAAAGVFGLIGSGTTGLLHTVVVWVTEEAGQADRGR